MAIQSSFKQQCPSCEAMVPIRDPKLIGRKIDCPKCKYRFVVEEPVDDVDEVEEDGPAKKGKGATGITNKKPANGKAVKSPAKRRADDDEELEDEKPKKKQSGGSGMLIVGIGLGAVALIALAVGGVFLFSGDKKEDNKSSGGPSASIAPGGGGNKGGNGEVAPPAPAQGGPKETIKPKQEDVTNLLPNDTQVVVNLPLEHLLGNGKIHDALLKTPGAFHTGAFQRIWGIAPSDIQRVVVGQNLRNKTTFAVMRTTQPMKEDKITAALKIKPEQPIGGLKYYLVKKPLDALSNFLLKAGEPHDVVALHFMDPVTLVCADTAPMHQFLQEKGQPKHLSKRPSRHRAAAAACPVVLQAVCPVVLQAACPVVLQAVCKGRLARPALPAAAHLQALPAAVRLQALPAAVRLQALPVESLLPDQAALLPDQAALRAATCLRVE
jgi:flagellar basal body-associated protein FliL